MANIELLEVFQGVGDSAFRVNYLLVSPKVRETLGAGMRNSGELWMCTDRFTRLEHNRRLSEVKRHFGLIYFVNVCPLSYVSYVSTCVCLCVRVKRKIRFHPD